MFANLSDRLTATFKTLRGKGRLSEEDVNATIREIRIALLDADVALPAVRVSYAVFRDKELEAYSGRSLFLRVLACSLAYAALWGAHSLLGGDLELWQWTFVTPFFLFAGGLAAVVSFDLDWGVGVSHYALYVFLTALMRYLAGITPVI